MSGSEMRVTTARPADGLASHVKLVRDVAAGEFVTSVDVEFDEDSRAVRIWRAMERDAGQETSSGRVGLQVLSST